MHWLRQQKKKLALTSIASCLAIAAQAHAFSANVTSVSAPLVVPVSNKPVSLGQSLQPALSNPYHLTWDCKPHDGKWICYQAPTKFASIYNKKLDYKAHMAALSKALGWVKDDSQQAGNCSVCGGHYFQPVIPESSDMGSLQGSYSNLTFNKALYRLNGPATFNGNVVLIQPGRELFADKAQVFPDPKTGQYQRIEASGNIRLRQANALILANHLDADFYDHKATLKQVTFLLKVTPNWLAHEQLQYDPNFTGYARGTAKTAQQLSQNIFEFHDATYTTCPPTGSTWKLDASKIILNNKIGRGYAYNTVLHIQGAPVFYLPYISFPLNSKRQSGFLYGTFSDSSSSGAAISLPYYFNLAPNYDFLYTPTYYSKRGLMSTGVLRYLTPSSQGFLRGSYLPHDQNDGGANRYYLNFYDKTWLYGNWTSLLQYQAVSDKNYFNDFSSNFNTYQAATTELPTELQIQYLGNNWTMLNTVVAYTPVDDALSIGNRNYNLLPQIEATGNYPYKLSPFTFSVFQQFTNFQKNPVLGVTAVEGLREVFNPTLSLPLTTVYGSLTPSITWYNSFYSLKNEADQSLTDANPGFSVPSFSLTGILNFYRDYQGNSGIYTQTLTPELMYLYTPYHNQDNIPNFDSALLGFNYDTLFYHNRFEGYDRVGDANQLSYALSSTLENPSGRDVLTGGIGQIYYLHNRRVTLCNNSLDPDCIVTEQPNYNHTFSDVATQLTYAPSTTWTYSIDSNYDVYQHNISSVSYGVAYTLNPTHIINLAYTLNKSDYGLLTRAQILSDTPPPKLSQFSASTLWAVTPKWSLMGYWNYSVNLHKAINEFVGLQYSTCCWAIRYVVRRYIDDTDPNLPYDLSGPVDRQLMLQFELKGLGMAGDDDIETLASEIPNYVEGASGFQ